MPVVTSNIRARASLRALISKSLPKRLRVCFPRRSKAKIHHLSHPQAQRVGLSPCLRNHVFVTTERLKWQVFAY